MSRSRIRIAIGELSHESNAFNPVQTTLADFTLQGIYYGDDVLRKCGHGEELGAFVQAAAEYPDIELVGAMRARANACGLVTTGTYIRLKAEMLGSLRKAGRLDGILLSLHGAMAAEGIPDVEGDLLEAIRREWGAEVPVVVSLDHHANVTEKMIENLDGLAGYLTEPHVDTYQTGVRAARILYAMVRGEAKPTLRWRHIPMIASGEIIPPKGVAGPYFLGVEKMESTGEALAVSIFPGFVYNDMPGLGWAVVAVTDSAPDKAQRICDDLAARLWEARVSFQMSRLPSPAEAVARALTIEGGPVVLSDAADAPTSGAPGDGTALLKVLLGRNIGGAAFVPVADPDVVAQAMEAGIGAEVTVQVGGKLDPARQEPVTLTGRVKTISDGVLSWRDHEGNPAEVRVGRTVVLQAGDVQLVASEKGQPTAFAASYRCVGLEPSTAKIVVVKSPMLFRADYEPIARGIILVDGPGCASTQLERFRDKYKLSGPTYPLDPDVRFPSAFAL